MKKYTVILMLMFVGMTLFIGCSSNTNDTNIVATAQDVESYVELCEYQDLEFAVDNKKFELVKDNTIPNEHDETIQRLFLQDKKSVYFFCKKIEGADPETFEILSYFFARDKNNIYIPNSWEGVVKKAIVIDRKNFEKSANVIDPKSFEVLSNFIVKDINNVYYFADGYLVISPKIDSKSFEILSEIHGKDKNNIYTIARNEELKVINDADKSSFEVLKVPDKPYDLRYSKDKNNVYYHENIINEADPATFLIINGIYSKDQNNCFRSGKIVDMDKCQ